MLKNSKKIIGSLLVALTLSFAAPCSQAFAESLNNGVERNYASVNGKWGYQFLLNGKPMKNQWYEYDTPAYRTDDKGNRIETIMEHNKSYLDENGCAVSGLQEIGGYTYYFSNYGNMLIGVFNVKMPSGNYEKYAFGSDGKRITDAAKFKYASKEFTISHDNTVTFTADGVTYKVVTDALDSNIVEKDGQYYSYYFDSQDRGGYHVLKSVANRNSWGKDENSNWYYNGSDFKPLKGYQTIDGKKYYFTEQTGLLKTSWWRSADSQWHYSYPDGSIKEGWLNYDGSWYYIYSDGIMAKDTTTPDGYYVNKKGIFAK